MTVNNWERHRTAPMVHWLPQIIDFLGYAPYDPAWGPGRRLRTAREGLELSQRKLGSLLGVDGSTVARWENGRAQPGCDVRKRLNALLAAFRA